MTTQAPRTTTATPGLSPDGDRFLTTRVGRKGNVIVSWVTSTDHKVIGNMYLITSFS